MKKSKSTEEQIALAPKQTEPGTRIEEVCWKMGISQATFYTWRKKFGGLGLHDVVAVMERLKHQRGLPQRIQTDNDSEFISLVLNRWAYDHGVTKARILMPGLQSTVCTSLSGR